MLNRISIDRTRFLADFDALSKFGMTPEGLNREAGSEAFGAARDFLHERMSAAGLKTRIDAAGNLFGVLPGVRADSRKLLSGSHLDSVTNGGAYDGPLGILAALEAVRAMRDAGYENRHAIEVAAFNAEEGGPLGGTFGSRAFTGVLREGDVPAETLAAYGMDARSLLAAKADVENYAASVELHIEQGPVLEQESIPIGIPTGIVGIARYEVHIAGTANHAGTTPMPARHDAMQAAVRILSEWFGLVASRDDFVCNVGTFALEPGHVSIVPGGATFVLELRALSAETLRETARLFAEIAAKEQICDTRVMRLGEKLPVELDDRVIATIADACTEMGLGFKKMPSGASHDSSPIAKVMPAGMIFVPSAKGISHSKDEFTEKEDAIRGAECLVNALLKLDTASWT